MGQTKLGDCEKYIDSMHMYSSGTNGLVMNMLSVPMLYPFCLEVVSSLAVINRI